MKKLETSVVICGAGPAGLTLAHLLGEQNVNVILIERLQSTVTEPRAIAIDGESLRTLQQVGLVDGFKDELLAGIEADYINGEGAELFKVGSPEVRPFGYAMINSFDQPTLDRYLAQRMAERNTVQLCFSTTLDRFEQDERGVRVYCTDAENNEIEIAADYLVGCDGGRSTIRAQLKIGMQGESNPQPWLVIDTVDKHLDNQMDARFFCDPARPGMTIRKRHSQRRWEWMLMPGEDREALLQDETIREIIAPYTDAEKVDIYRKRVYDFHAIIAERWQEGRVFLAGDAAHMTPPFAGQGLNSGFRDVTNLSWKLAAVVKGNADASILDSYELERRDHALELIETALELGKQIQPIDPEQAAQRDALFEMLNQDPAAMQELVDGIGASLLNRSVAKGLAVEVGQGTPSGRLLVQPELVSPEGIGVLLDDCLGSGFAIIAYDCNPAEVLDTQTLEQWNKIGTRLVAITSTPDSANSESMFDKGRVLGDWMEAQGPLVLLVRPDRFCMAAASPSQVIVKLDAAHRLLCPL